MSAPFQDLRYAARTLARNPGFSAAAVLTLGLGIGATTAIFTVVSGVLMRPLPYPQPEQLVYVQENLRSGLNPFAGEREFQAWRDRSRTLSRIAAYISFQANLSGDAGAERVNCGNATASFFQLLGARPLLGRTFLPAEGRKGAAPVAILSEKLWRRRFAADRFVLGRPLVVDGKSYTIVGVLPQTFRVPDRWGFTYDVWVPFDFGPALQLMRAVGRLKPGVTPAQAQAELDTILQSTLKKGTSKHAVVAAWHDEITGGARTPLLIFMTAVGLVLLIACVNVANLLLSRSASRRTEMALRLTLGATRRRVLRQLLTESTLLALLGGLAGLLVALWGKDLLAAFLAPNLPEMEPMRMDFRVLAFTLALALLTGIAFGLVPALRASRVSLNESLKEGGRSIGAGKAGGHFRDALVVGQIALATVLLIGAGLLFRSFLRLRGLDAGFKPDHILTLTVDLTPSEFPEPRDQSRYFQAVIERIGKLGGVQAVGANSALPLGEYSASADLKIEGQPDSGATVSYGTVSPDYFRTLGIPLLRGRYFTDADGEGASSVAIVNESLVHRYLPNQPALGKRIQSWVHDGDWMTIVGVVGDVRDELEQSPVPEVYLSYLQAGNPYMSLVVRTAGDPRRTEAAVRGQVASVAKDQPPFEVETLDDLRAEILTPRRVNMLLFGAFAALAVVLGSIGIYGVVAYSVSQRTHEIGVRMALGAGKSDVLAMVVGRGLRLVIAGDALGLVSALVFNRVLRGLVFLIATTDGLTYAAVSVLWTSIALLAYFLPAQRATKVDPMIALRYE
jgi:putative ABC transport system permease protein